MVVATEEYMKKLVSALLASSMLFLYVPTLGAAGPVNIIHEKITCAPDNAQPKLYARVTPLTPVTSLQVLFRSTVYKNNYALDMRREGPGDRYFVMLPWPAKNTKEFTYQIVGKNAAGIVSSTEQAIVPFSSNCPVFSLSKQEKDSAAHLILVLTAANQPTAPPEGWECKNIDYVITANGEKEPAEGCRKLLAALLPGAAGAGAAVGVSTGLAVGVGVGVVAAVAAGGLIYSNNTGNKTPVSSARPAAQSPTHN
jgi:hypothetical protein